MQNFEKKLWLIRGLETQVRDEPPLDGTEVHAVHGLMLAMDLVAILPAPSLKRIGDFVEHLIVHGASTDHEKCLMVAFTQLLAREADERTKGPFQRGQS